MNKQKYRSKYPDIAHLLHDTEMSYAEIGRKFGVTRQYIHWLNKRLGQFGRPPKSKVASTRKAEIADQALKMFSNYSAC